MQATQAVLGLLTETLPGAPDPPEGSLHLVGTDAVTVVDNKDGGDGLGCVALQLDRDRGRLGIDRVPHQLHDRTHSVTLVSEASNQIVARLKYQVAHGTDCKAHRRQTRRRLSPGVLLQHPRLRRRRAAEPHDHRSSPSLEQLSSGRAPVDSVGLRDPTRLLSLRDIEPHLRYGLTQRTERSARWRSQPPCRMARTTSVAWRRSDSRYLQSGGLILPFLKYLMV